MCVSVCVCLCVVGVSFSFSGKNQFEVLDSCNNNKETGGSPA